MENPFDPGPRPEDRVAVGRGQGTAQHPGRAGAFGGAFEELDERATLDTHRPHKDGIGCLDPGMQLLVRRVVDVEVDQLEVPLVPGHLRRERDQSQGREYRLPTHVLQYVLVAPEGVGGDFWRNEQAFPSWHIPYLVKVRPNPSGTAQLAPAGFGGQVRSSSAGFHRRTFRLTAHRLSS